MSPGVSRSLYLPLKIRLIMRVAILVICTFASAGCSLLTPAATTITYSAGVGASANLGTILIRNIFIVADDSGHGFLVMTVFTDKRQTITAETSSSKQVELFLSEGSNVFGPKVKVTIDNVGAAPGDYVELTLSSKTSIKKVVAPVLSSEFPDYKYITQEESKPSHAFGRRNSNQIQGIV
ncbi:MAG: hypothetical protein NKF37_01205 [Tropheryma whipplei]|nr:hypothetical protein [Tropheryma whipplei]